MNVSKQRNARCVGAVIDYYVPSEAPGCRPTTEFTVAATIAMDADSDGILMPLEMSQVAAYSRLSVRTVKRYVAILFEIGWLIESYKEGQPILRIDPDWLKKCPVRPQESTHE